MVLSHYIFDNLWQQSQFINKLINNSFINDYLIINYLLISNKYLLINNNTINCFKKLNWKHQEDIFSLSHWSGSDTAGGEKPLGQSWVGTRLTVLSLPQHPRKAHLGFTRGPGDRVRARSSDTPSQEQPWEGAVIRKNLVRWTALMPCDHLAREARLNGKASLLLQS